MNYESGTWDETPRQLFDQQRWAECLHATVQVFNLGGHPRATQAALEDTGVIHELAHLACGIDTWTHRSREELRELVPDMVSVSLATPHFRAGILMRWGALWVGAHWSTANRRLCINLIPCVTIGIAAPGGVVP